jgi:hypothetical protein
MLSLCRFRPQVGEFRSKRLNGQWSLAFWLHKQHPDGILYPSRLNEEINLALYDVALAKARLSLAFDEPHLVGRTSLWSIGLCAFRSFG